MRVAPGFKMIGRPTAHTAEKNALLPEFFGERSAIFQHKVGEVLVISVPGNKGSGTLFRLAS
jgi:hypothetical protein